MCRIFGFRSNLESKIHQSLVTAEESFADKSVYHRDGWGVAYYNMGVPHVFKSINCAIEDSLFHKLSSFVSSTNILAHIRKKTQGDHSLLDSHPFQFGLWTFVHNGNIRNFEKLRNDLLKLICPELSRYVLGKTDSEVIFFIILTELKKQQVLSSDNHDKIESILKQALSKIIKVIGALDHYKTARPTDNFLTIVLTNGSSTFITQGGQPLYYSTHKTKCPESLTCNYYDSSCENKAHSGELVNHLIFSSEKIKGQNVWIEMSERQLISADKNLKLNITNF